MLIFLKKTHTFLHQFLVAFFFFLFYPFFYLLSRRERHYRLLNRFRRAWGRFSFFFCGIFYRVYYEEKPDKNQTYVYCPNHSSHLDIPLMCILAKGSYHFMGKVELLKHPVLGIFFRTIDIPVNRSSKIGSFKAFIKAGENLAKGHSLVLFPEGKIPDEAPLLHAFKDGAFRLAIQKKVPIIPVTFVNNWKLMLDDGKEGGSRPGLSRVFFHKPIPTDHLKEEDADLLKQQVFDIIHKKLQEENPELITLEENFKKMKGTIAEDDPGINF